MVYFLVEYILGFDPDELIDVAHEDRYGYSLAILLTKIGFTDKTCEFSVGLPGHYIFAKLENYKCFDNTPADIYLTIDGLLHVLLYANGEEFKQMRDKLKHQLKVNPNGFNKLTIACEGQC